jgi:hypothetical protein
VKDSKELKTHIADPKRDAMSNVAQTPRTIASVEEDGRSYTNPFKLYNK